MCGIVGYFSWTGRPLARAALDAMVDAVSHRGPDDRGVWQGDSVALGHTRLSIIDLSRAGRQPMSNETGDIWLTFNGEIYNFEALRAELIAKGHTFRSNADSEVILHQYEEDGEGCLRRLNGMFAFALWDASRRRLILARDRAGEKPLFYYATDGFIVFGSEIKSLLASGLVPVEIDSPALLTGLIYNAMAAPRTIVKGIRQIVPGAYLDCGDGPPAEKKYWDLLSIIRGRKNENRTDEEWLDGFNSHLHRSVKMRMRSDVDYGAYLSGGLDSTAVVKTMTEFHGLPVKTFSFGFREASFDESKAATLVSRIFGTEHFNSYASASALPGLVEKIVYHSEEYTPNPTFLPAFLLAGHAREHVKMVLSGDGGDELLAGYETYQASFMARVLRRFPAPVRRAVAWAIERLPVSNRRMPLEAKLKRFLHGVESDAQHPHVLWRHIFSLSGARDILQEHYAREAAGFDPLAVYSGDIDDARDMGFLTSLQYADFRNFMPNDAVLRSDRTGMAHGLEVRAPFLDHEFVEYVFGMPENLKLRWLTVRKYALRRYLRNSVPPQILNQRKLGFNAPIDDWLRGPLKEFLCDHTTPESLAKADVFKAERVNEMVSRHLDRQRNHGFELWNILCLTIWHKLFANGRKNGGLS